MHETLAFCKMMPQAVERKFWKMVESDADTQLSVVENAPYHRMQTDNTPFT
jgi:hypothetical protein